MDGGTIPAMAIGEDPALETVSGATAAAATPVRGGRLRREGATLAADVACFRVEGEELLLLLVRRAAEPFAATWALPGGLVGAGEGLDAAAHRVLADRTGIASSYLEQLYTFGDPGRDPRGRTVSVAYSALLGPAEAQPAPGRGVQAVAWHPARALPTLAFDHARIAAYAVWRLAGKIEYTPLAFRVLAETFTISDLRLLYQAVTGQRVEHASNFMYEMRRRWALEDAGETRETGARGRPARLFRYTGRQEIPGTPPDLAAAGTSGSSRMGGGDAWKGHGEG